MVRVPVAIAPLYSSVFTELGFSLSAGECIIRGLEPFPLARIGVKPQTTLLRVRKLAICWRLVQLQHLSAFPELTAVFSPVHLSRPTKTSVSCFHRATAARERQAEER